LFLEQAERVYQVVWFLLSYR